MDPVNHKTFGDWLSNEMNQAGLSLTDVALQLGYADNDFIADVCRNKSRLPIKDWPNVSKAFRMRMDEFLIVMEYYHPDWLMEYDSFISNCLRYLLWRMENDSVREHGWLDGLLRTALEEIIEPACSGRFYGKMERRHAERRKVHSTHENDLRIHLRRVSDLVQFLRLQLNLVPGLALGVWAASVIQAWVHA